MNKYIDADKLIANLERQNVDKKVIEPLIHIINSLQQEQPEVDLVAELKHHLATTPKEQLEKEWKELEPWGNIGPTVQEFLYGKQPEVDLKKEIKEWVDLMVGASFPEQDGDFISEEDYRSVIRQTALHFLGLNARKEE